MASDLPQFKSETTTTTRRSLPPRLNKRILVTLAVSGIFFLLYLNARVTTPSSSGPQDNQPQQVNDPNLAPPPPNGNVIVPLPQDEDEDDGQDTVPDLLSEGDEEQQEEDNVHTSNEIINTSNHYKYLVVIASTADQMTRRQLIRERYFGLRDNLLPCMRFNADTMYTFWIHGGSVTPRTAERRRYEAEKMEWNDLEELPAGVSFTQASVLEWAETTLADRGISYDYLIVQDIHTFVHIAGIRQELEHGVISEDSESPVAVDHTTNMVWAQFTNSDQVDDSQVFVVGAAAARVALEKRNEIQSSSHLLTDLYHYYQSNEVDQVKNDATVEFGEDEGEAEVQVQTMPLFIPEAQRFMRWENNVESVHEDHAAVTHVYQDTEFVDLARWTSLEPVRVCYPPKSAYKPTLQQSPMDDDEEMTLSQDDLSTTVNKDQPSIALMTSSFIYDDNCMEPSATKAALNKRKYAERHGHTFVARSTEFAQQRGRKTVWGKVDAVEKVLPKYDWIFWMDMDAVIMNQEHSLFELLDDLRTRYGDGQAFDEHVDLITAKPRGDPMLNAGVFFLRNTEWSRQFLRQVQQVTEWYNRRPAYEQGAMWQIMLKPENQPHIYLLENDDHTFNTFPKRYQPGDFIVHFAPDKCPNALTLQGLAAAERIEVGQMVTAADLM
ncbi:hypothetical protein O0I10_007563 [Lichtheimia ornata]|uniref:Glycosyltransferase family 34 protein n=1 Tax=Lichtheimia ornata TaxID=688661 RepID=A0AAD7V1C2_9FUNG|nr:uncharacterized protein O0I10_007563 [Lichtheimia ornata]KAJ8656716.1 hypothetical protein O0I10_007563 [Lichtheimia ornata]